MDGGLATYFQKSLTIDQCNSCKFLSWLQSARFYPWDNNGLNWNIYKQLIWTFNIAVTSIHNEVRSCKKPKWSDMLSSLFLFLFSLMVNTEEVYLDWGIVIKIFFLSYKKNLILRFLSLHFSQACLKVRTALRFPSVMWH